MPRPPLSAVLLRKARSAVRRIGLAPPAPSRAQYRVLDAGPDDGLAPSVLFFTTHKCASTFITRALSVAAAAGGLRHLDYAVALYNLGDAIDTGEVPHTEIERLIEPRAPALFRSRGEIYGPLRRPVDFPGREALTHVFFLRDPRDVIVSAFHSFGASHGTPPNARMAALFQAERARIRAEGIDAYSLRAARDWIAPLYRTYAAWRDAAPTSHVLSYDAYRADPAGFLDELCRRLQVTPDPEALADLVRRAAPVRPRLLPGTRHRRSGLSRQFETALAPATQAALNDLLGDILETWEFER